jgi:hypothetical protein
MRLVGAVLLVVVASLARSVAAVEGPDSAADVPFIDGDWWQVAGNPDLGKFNDPRQEPVDFSIWQAADGTWQLWSCIRKTKCGGNTRLFYGWEGKSITSPNWRPVGIKMTADTALGETAGGLQAPHVVRSSDTYYMLYGDWEHICLATSRDGKKFERYIEPNGKTGLFTEGLGFNTRDPFAMRVGREWYVYYTAYPNKQGAVYCRKSSDLHTFSESTTVAFGGRTGVGPFSAECPQVVGHEGMYYLFRTQHYADADGGPRSCVYASRDPLNFGINQDRLYFVTELPIAAPEIVSTDGQQYIAALLPSLKGIRIAKLEWKRKNARVKNDQ